MRRVTAICIMGGGWIWRKYRRMTSDALPSSQAIETIHPFASTVLIRRDAMRHASWSHGKSRGLGRGSAIRASATWRALLAASAWARAVASWACRWRSLRSAGPRSARRGVRVSQPRLGGGQVAGGDRSTIDDHQFVELPRTPSPETRQARTHQPRRRH